HRFHLPRSRVHHRHGALHRFPGLPPAHALSPQAARAPHARTPRVAGGIKIRLAAKTDPRLAHTRSFRRPPRRRSLSHAHLRPGTAARRPHRIRLVARCPRHRRIFHGHAPGPSPTIATPRPRPPLGRL